MNIEQIRIIIDQPDNPTWDLFLDSRYVEQIGIIGHVNPYYRTFYRLAMEFKPKLSVELGSWQATAAAHLAAGNREGIVYTIDIHKDDKGAQGRAIEAAAHYPNLFYINKWTWDAAPDIEALGLPIDILYIDAWHDYQYAIKEWELYSPMLADPALVICDDIVGEDASNHGMLKFWDEVSSGRESYLCNSIHCDPVNPANCVPMGFVIWTG